MTGFACWPALPFPTLPLHALPSRCRCLPAMVSHAEPSFATAPTTPLQAPAAPRLAPARARTPPLAPLCSALVRATRPATHGPGRTARAPHGGASTQTRSRCCSRPAHRNAALASRPRLRAQNRRHRHHHHLHQNAQARQHAVSNRHAVYSHSKCAPPVSRPHDLPASRQTSNGSVPMMRGKVLNASGS